MSDIVERLRARNAFFKNGGIWMMTTVSDPDCREAADEIDRLLAAADGWEKLFRDGKAEIERLRADLDYVRKSKDEARQEIEQLRFLEKQYLEVIRQHFAEIERLQSTIEKWERYQIVAQYDSDQQRAEIERLKAEAKASDDEAYRAWAMVQDKEAEIERLQARLNEADRPRKEVSA